MASTVSATSARRAPTCREKSASMSSARPTAALGSSRVRAPAAAQAATAASSSAPTSAARRPKRESPSTTRRRLSAPRPSRRALVAPRTDQEGVESRRKGVGKAASNALKSSFRRPNSGLSRGTSWISRHCRMPSTSPKTCPFWRWSRRFSSMSSWWWPNTTAADAGAAPRTQRYIRKRISLVCRSYSSRVRPPPASSSPCGRASRTV
mmetsp:Transcript_48989/g.146384  ORF Transcript_48989/g.146384 Transcript_48989/m.146384 type:complete len:208 (-) Transcript_48989:143-766(-)